MSNATGSKIVSALLEESVAIDESSYSDTGYNDYSDHSDSPSWSDNWNDGPNHSDSWGDSSDD